MRKPVLTCNKLLKLLQQFEKDGCGEYPVLFDTEARKFDYHMAEVARAYACDDPEPHINLQEDRS